jgi:glycosyltransferase involved in cell wall biosynthesis
MNYRQFYFAREFVRAGHEVLIVSSSYSHQFLVQPQTKGIYTKQKLEGVDYIWIKCPSFNGSADPKRILNWLVFTASLYGIPRQAAAKPDAIIVSSPIPYPIVPAAWMARRLGARLIFEVRDLWPLSLIDLGSYSEKNPFIRVTQWVEDFAYRRANLVVSALPKAYEHMKTRGLSSQKFTWISNGVDPDDLLPQQNGDLEKKERAGTEETVAEGGGQRREARVESKASADNARKQFKVCYAGSFHARAVALSLVEAAALLRNDRPNIRFILIGKDSGGLSILKDRAAALGVDTIDFRDPVPRTAMQGVLAEMDLCVGMTKSSPLYRFGISLTKLFDYMLAAKPIILSSNASGDIVSESGCGVKVPAEDAQALAEAIRKMADMNPLRLSQMGDSGRRTLLASFTYPRLAARYLEAIREASQG